MITVPHKTMQRPLLLLAALLLAVATGCGTTKSRTATQQLLVSDAVDEAIASIDFRAMAFKKVYLDSSFITEVKNAGFVNSQYIIGSIRQQMVAANCLLQESRDDAEYIVEARVGTVGADGNEIVYGLPASSSLSTAASLVPNAPAIPIIPEIALAKKVAEIGAAKVAVFAYHRETREPVWQSGISRGKSTAQDYWVLGAGPFQRGTIYDGIGFAGQEIRIPGLAEDGSNGETRRIAYHDRYLFDPELSRVRVAQRKAERANALIQDLPTADAEEWLTPLTPSLKTPIEESLWWR